MIDNLSTLVKVSDNNPGAAVLCKKLMYFPRWFEMMEYLAEHGPRGSDLWILYKDVFHEDLIEFGFTIELRMRAAKNECLPSVSLAEVRARKAGIII